MNARLLYGQLPLGLLCCLALAIVSCDKNAPAAGNSENDSNFTSASSATPTVSDNRSESDPALADAIDKTIDHSEFAAARWGVFVIAAANNRVLYARNADKLFTPASNMKVYTTAVALDLLGADYRWRTSVYANQPPTANGDMEGDLILYGRGAPDLTSKPRHDVAASIAQLADQLYARGLRRVRGNVIGDESYFRSQPLGAGWQWNDAQWYFGAEPSALSINDNEVDVSIEPAKFGTPPGVTLSAAQDYVHLTATVASVKRGEP